MVECIWSRKTTLNFHKLSSEWLPLQSYRPLSDKLYISLHIFSSFLGLILHCAVESKVWTEDHWIVVVEVLLTQLCELESLSVILSMICTYYVYIRHMIIIQWTTCIFNIFKLKINLNATKQWIILIYLRLHIYIWLHFYVVHCTYYLSCSL